MGRLRTPKDWKDYKGVGKGFQPSADGFDYWYVCGWRRDVFGMYLLKQRRSGTEPAVFVDYPPPVMEGRGEMYLGGDGKLYITGNNSDADTTPRVELALGFVPFSAGVAPPTVMVIDQIARDTANAALGQSVHAKNVAEQTRQDSGEALRLARVANQRPIPDAVPDAHIADIAWAKMQDFTSVDFFKDQVQRIAQQVLLDAIEFAQKGTVKQSRLRALITSIVKGN